MSLQPIFHQNMADAVYDALRQAIFDQSFAPGQRLNIDELRQELGVSRTPLKDALNRLAIEGLVRIVPRQGSFVSELRPDKLAEVLGVRRALELYAIAEAMPRLEEQHLASMRECLWRQRTLTSDGDADQYMTFVTLDHGFHSIIFEAAGNRTLREIYEGLNVHMQVARARHHESTQHISLACEEHEAILRAFEARDAAAASAAMDAHLATARRAVLEWLH